jgi:hypothetical protein
MRPEPDVAAGGADVIGMVIGDAGVVNWEPLVRRRVADRRRAMAVARHAA